MTGFLSFFSFVLSISLFLGLMLLVLYVISNALSNARWFQRSPRFLRNIIYFFVDLGYRWGPILVVTYLVGSLALRLLNFLITF